MTERAQRVALAVLLPLAALASTCGSGEGDTPTDAGIAELAPDAVDAEPDALPADANGDAEPDTDPIDPDAVVLLRNGQSQHRIVLQTGASPSERHAAAEIQTHFEACTGVRLPIVDGAPAEGVPMIVIGRGPVAQRLGVDPSDADLGDQGFAIETATPHLVIAGTPQAGTLYGVYRFLEESLTVRWLAPGVTTTPPAADLVIPPTHRLVQPAFFWRSTSYEWPGADADFRPRQTYNSGSAGADSPQGVQYDGGGAAHTYLRFVSPDEFFDEHPEYFSEIGGQRVRDETQLCLTNPDVLDIVTERMLEQMAADPGARQHTFSQMDYYNQCECDACRAINEQYGTAGGTQFWFVNQLAERTSQVYPDKLIRTLAYMYTEEPPTGMQMHPNVAVWLCHMYPSCDSHSIESCPLNADYERRARAWSALTDHLYVWHYATNFTHYYMPFPNLRALAEDIRFYRDIGVEGIYLQGMGHAGGGGEFSLLRPYYGMQLLWDPSQDPDRIVDDFLEGYFGAAWPPIRSYVDLLHDEVEQNDIHMHLYTNPAQGYLTDPIVERAEGLFDDAESLVSDDAELLERVKVARMPLVYARLFPRNGYEIRDGNLTWSGEIASFQEVLDFAQRMAEHGFETIREWEGGRDTLLLLYAILGQDLEVVTLENERMRVEIIPMLGGRALRIIDRATGETVTAHNVTRSLFFPFAGGLDDRVGGLFRFFGWVEPATVVEQTTTSVTLESDTFSGLALRRTLTLNPLEPILVAESVVTNPGDRALPLTLRSHLELDLGDLASTRVRFTNRGGQEIDQDMTAVIAGLREGQHFYQDDIPAGSWTFSGSKGLEVTQRFSDEQVEHTWLYAYPETLGELEVEVWGPRTELQPAESLGLRVEIALGAP